MPPPARVRFGRPLSAAALSAAAALLPSQAAAQGTILPGQLSPIGWAAAALVFVFGGLLLWMNRRRSRAVTATLKLEAKERLLRAGLETARAAALTWEPDGSIAVTPNTKALLGLEGGEAPALTDILGAFEGTGHAVLGAAVTELRTGGKDFVQTFKLKDRPRFVLVHGKRLGSGAASVDFLGFQDTTDALALLIEREREAQRLRGVIDTLPVPIWIRDEQQHLVDCNAAYVRAVEAPDRDAVLAEHREFAEGTEAGTARALAEKAHASGARETVQQHIVVEGTRRLFEIGEQPISAACTAGYALDITSTEETKKSVARHTAAHNEVLERLAIAIIIVGPDGAIKFFNGAFARLWSLSEAWLEAGPTLSDLLDQLRQQRMLPETGNFAALRNEWMAWIKGMIEPRQELLHLPNGMAIWMVVSPHPLGGLLFTFENVTYRLALERSVNTLAAVQRDTIDHLFDGVAVFGEDGCLKLSNPTFRRMWTLDEEFSTSNPHVGVVVERIRALLPVKKGWEKAKAAIMSRVTNRRFRQGRVRIADDRIFAYALVPLPDGGVLVSCRDVTDSVRVERALRERAEALEAADRVKADFIANISYELRTPLNAIIGFTEILNNQYFGQLNERQLEYTEGVLEASQHLLTLINDILDLAVIEAGRMVLDIEPVSVKSIVDSVLQITGEWARGQDLHLEADVPADVGIIQADERRLKHALFNLVGNAIKFTPQGGRIAVSARRQGQQVALAVEDTGMGIPDEDARRVFDTFVRGKDKHGRPAGAGLGLALVRSLIELHGGRVEMQSKSGVGTKVTCWLPVRAKITQSPAAPQPRLASPPLADGGLRRNKAPHKAA
ncbi:MAG: PAS-domain containing protein [Rhodospirillaceae bacterium]|nr:PAS-domain containing protein [Rhodospirillaceae bacterium]